MIQQRLGRNKPVHWFLGGKGLDIQQGPSVWVGSPKSYNNQPYRGQVFTSSHYVDVVKQKRTLIVLVQS